MLFKGIDPFLDIELPRVRVVIRHDGEDPMKRAVLVSYALDVYSLKQSRSLSPLDKGVVVPSPTKHSC